MTANQRSRLHFFLRTEICVDPDALPKHEAESIIRDEMKHCWMNQIISICVMAMGFVLMLLEVLSIGKAGFSLSGAEIFGVTIGSFISNVGIVFFIVGFVLLITGQTIKVEIRKQ